MTVSTELVQYREHICCLNQLKCGIVKQSQCIAIAHTLCSVENIIHNKHLRTYCCILSAIKRYSWYTLDMYSQYTMTKLQTLIQRKRLLTPVAVYKRVSLATRWWQLMTHTQHYCCWLLLTMSPTDLRRAQQSQHLVNGLESSRCHTSDVPLSLDWR
jgi:hypothetical protein